MCARERLGDCEEFYRSRDQRTLEYLNAPVQTGVSVYVEIDAAACGSEPGQLALLSLANQLARVHRRITFALADPAVPVVARTPFPGRSLGEVLLATVEAIDPCGEFSIGSAPPAPCVSIGIGEKVRAGLGWYIGARRSIAYLQHSPIELTPDPGTLRGAALAACLGCSAVLRTVLGLQTTPRVLSAWNFAEGNAAAPGPGALGAVDVGRVLMVGAGAVGSALGYWLHAFGFAGDNWVVVDRDVVKLHNTNRSLAFTAQHAGWPVGEQRKKAEVVAELIPRAIVHPRWYHECEELKRENFDVVLALANDYEVRERLSQRSAVVALQATTGENWLSQLHRHVVGRDGCIWCRTGEVRTAALSCSSGITVDGAGGRSDAALPFLSAASGLMLAAAIERLTAGDLLEGETNCWSWDFGSSHRMVARPAARQCQPGCALVLPHDIRRTVNVTSKWASCDVPSE